MAGIGKRPERRSQRRRPGDFEAEWTEALIPITATLGDVIANLDRTALQIAMVADGDRRLIGTVTDGDVRRGLLRGLDLKNNIEAIIFRDPMVVAPEMSREMVLQLMNMNKIYRLPVVDEHRRIVGLHSIVQLMEPPRRPNLMVIMAGGVGSRLLPHTATCPKPLLPVAGKPILEHIIERARNDGLHWFVLAVRYLGHMVEEFCGDGSRWQVQVSYVRESAPLGTAGAIRLVEPRPDRPFLVTNGDVLTDIHYGEILDFHERHSAAATMAVRQHEWQHPFGVVRTNGVDIVGFEEKPISRTHINAGVYVLEPSVLDLLEPNEHCDMPTLFNRVRQSGARTIVYPIHEPWLDVGNAGDLATAREIATESDET